MKVWKANLMLLLVALIWGYGFIATDQSLKYLTPLQMQVFRFGVAAIILSLFSYKKLKKINKKTILYGCILGIVFFVAMSFQNYGLKLTTVPKNAFLTITSVVFVPLITFVLYKKKPEAHLIVGILIMLVGFFFLMFDINILNIQESISSLESLINFNLGDFLTLMCAIAFAFQYILVGRFVKDEDPIIILIFQLLTSAILSIIMSMFVDGSLLKIETQQLLNSLPSLAFLVIFSSILSFGMQLVAQKYVPASNAAVICTLESLFATFFAIILGLEVLSLSLVIASIIITIGVIYAETGFKFKSFNN